MARTSAAVRAYNRAITMQERVNIAAGEEWKNGFLPERVTVADVRERIHDVNDYRRIVGYRNDAAHGRPSELDRVLKKVNPTALDVVGDENGEPVTRYVKKEVKYAARQKERARKRNAEIVEKKYLDHIAGLTSLPAPEPIEPSFAEELLSYSESAYVPTDAGFVDEDYYQEETYNDELRRLQLENARESVSGRYDEFLALWTDDSMGHQELDGYDDVMDAMRWMWENYPGDLGYLLDEEVTQNDWLYESPKSHTNYYNKGFERRHSETVDKVIETAESLGWRKR